MTEELRGKNTRQEYPKLRFKNAKILSLYGNKF